LPLVVDAARVRVTNSEISSLKFEIANKAEIQEGKIQNGTRSVPPAFVTFVNPEPRKGVHVFARIAEVLARRRPDVPLLLVEGVARANSLRRLGIDPGSLGNVAVMPNGPDPRKFYAATRLVLMPSLAENAGFVAMEAMTNGIPVLASNRGGLPETIGDAAPLIEIPARYTPETLDLPAAEEVEPWVETIVRLWDDAAEYECWRRAALARARQWSAESLAGTYADFFANLVPQAAPQKVSPRHAVGAAAALAPVSFIVGARRAVKASG
jgi:glycosyltransferase involved in cell wall biosynthesis